MGRVSGVVGGRVVCLRSALLVLLCWLPWTVPDEEMMRTTTTRALLLSKARQQSTPSFSAFNVARGLSTKPKEPEKPKLGKPYKELSVGVIKETFPLEKRVAATPEVSVQWTGSYISFSAALGRQTHCNSSDTATRV